MSGLIEKALLTEEQIQTRVKELAEEIERDFNGEDVLLVGILKGAVVFVSDLMRNMKINVSIDFMAVSSYGNSTTSSGVVKLIKDLDTDIKNKNVIIVEDIIDSGLTLNYLQKNLRDRSPKALKICTLLDKPERRKCDIPVDYCGFEIPDKFIVGYGIDYAEKYRQLPYIGIVETK
ncbi:hypoxanthine phosphoribosyltransferase [Bacillus taeanensis]|uniref:Hypoxanthine phosphoribosyltransferase n=1 Tax=Bacillus taeanensis TaxID=273032 RepID=A0A366Y3V9_9BACI|nr:hypoxanthine phosphoribosyltransferase [Bacillus taeanensis]RBW70871.1 hypoxanthine phosphoribosyltransferase [Bacillus taeanensis]